MMNLHNVMKEIPLTEIGQIQIGHAQDFPAATGCTVILCPEGAAAGVDVRGGGPASRETQLLNPVAAAEKIHTVLLSGGSAFGLDAAGALPASMTWSSAPPISARTRRWAIRHA